MRRLSFLRFPAILLAAFIGGFAAQALLQPTSLLASASRSTDPVFIYGDDGQVRLQMGTYTASGEKGLPLVGLSDNSGRLRMLFRLAGSNEAPVIIMKDTSGHDRLVMGLGMSGNSEAPFLNIVDDSGTAQNILAR